MSNTINGFTGKYWFLSNFYEAPVTVSGINYRSSEVAYQAAKTLDMDLRQEFSKLSSKEAKIKGRTLKVRSDWNITSIEVMELCLRAKFMSHPDLAAKLIETGDATLVEFNTWGDMKWGKTSKGGSNLLGKLLMNIREDLTKG